MQANEITIRDWVYDVEDHYRTQVEPTPIQLDRETFIDILCRETCHDDLSLECHYAPIPLTEEMLLLNGFKKEKYGYKTPIQPSIGESLIVEIGTNGRFISTTNYEEPIAYCQFVHELQHLLRFCELDSIADNFKLKQ